MTKKSNINQASTKKDVSRIEKFLIDGFKNVGKEFKNVGKEFKNLRSEILRVEARVENLEEGQKRLETKVDNLEIKMDSFAGTYEALKEENTVGADHTRELRVQVDDHEARITTLEP